MTIGTTRAIAFWVNRFHAQLMASPTLKGGLAGPPNPGWVG
ncbi:proline and glycine rich transmembrane domain protein [Mycobacterium ulcerans str. Harvey]|uniref:Proline and glycine rich transmembrane domain protein n=1 Tax=Mycobacterium ulcerans str. Harvey TaxID=1299332 RepID=A0ABP3ALJ5_MYCUL|nr:proline and glycine rich transmembrane domain protein [Mycobacterium ulcerans str. Harvey]